MGILLENLFYAFPALLKIQLPRYRNGHDISFSLHELNHNFGTLNPCLDIICSNEHKPLGLRIIGIHADHWNALFDCIVDRVCKQPGLCRRHQHSGGVLCQDLLEFRQFCLGVVRIRANTSALMTI